MPEYKMLKPESQLTREELIAMYNDAVETIMELQHDYKNLDEAYDDLLCDYEKVSDQLYG